MFATALQLVLLKAVSLAQQIPIVSVVHMDLIVPAVFAFKLNQNVYKILIALLDIATQLIMFVLALQVVLMVQLVQQELVIPQLQHVLSVKLEGGAVLLTEIVAIAYV